MKKLKPSAVARLKDTYRSKSGVLLPAIQRHVMKQVSVFDDDRRSDIMHPSELSKPDWCPRHDFYRMTGVPVSKSSTSNPSFQMENVFAVGNSIHEKWQGWCWEMGLLYGKFRCHNCLHVWVDQSPLVCPECGSNHLHYVELGLESEEYMIAGHSDGALHGLPVAAEEGMEKWDILIEVKSIGLRTLAFEADWLWERYQQGLTPDEVWKQITRPFPSHIKQGQMYLWLADDRYTHIAFIYESKFNQQTKEFLVKKNSKILEPILAEAKDVADCIRQGMTPTRPSWATESDGKVCKSCVYRTTCWELEEVSHDEKAEETAPVKVRRSTSAKRRKALRST